MRRAYLEASSFARYRRAFGRGIASFPMVREQLAVMKVEELAAIASTMALTALIASLDDGRASNADADVYRFLVNANKYLTSTAATDVARRGIEVLGGNGTIEDFSPLPRLYRDAMVFESWEGTHNVLCAQVQRDCVRFGLLDSVLPWIRTELSSAGEASGTDGSAVIAFVEELEPRLQRSLADGDTAAAHFRRQLDRLMRAIQAACLLREAALEDTVTGKAAAASLFVRRYLVPEHEPEDDSTWSRLVDEVLAGDVG